MNAQRPFERPARRWPVPDRPDPDGARVSADVPAAGQTDWRQWMRDLGRRLRDTREFLVLSQQEVATLAGVSQGAVSRLETGHGLATPLLVVLKVQRALARHLETLDPTVLGPELARSVEFTAALMPSDGDPRITRDPALDELVRLYRDTPERQRDRLLAVVRAVVGGLKAASS